MVSLVVEDETTSQMVLKSILSSFGEVHAASTGREGLERYERMRRDGTPYALVCLDINLPGMSGQDVLRVIREMEERDGAEIPAAKILMITGMDDKKSVIHAFRQQCDAYLVKPVQAKELFEQIEGFGFIRVNPKA